MGCRSSASARPKLVQWGLSPVHTRLAVRWVGHGAARILANQLLTN